VSKPYFFTWTKQSGAQTLPVQGADGPYVILEDGTPLADLSSVSYQASFGLQHPHLARKIKDQADAFAVAHPKASFELKEHATKRLLNYLNLPTSGRIFYTVSGAESVENALKMARQLTGKSLVLARNIAYHGATLGALSVTGDWRNPPHLTASHWTVRIPEPSEDPQGEKTRQIIIEAGPENIAALIVETITGGNGVIIPPKSWWKSMESLAREFNFLLIADEVICGFHRTGSPTGIEHFSVTPDLVCLAKGISGGMVPFGALWVREELAQRYDTELIFSYGLTSYAHPLGLAVMEGVLDLLEDREFQQNFKSLCEVFAHFFERIKTLASVREVRVIGLLGAIDLHRPVSLDRAHELGIHFIAFPERLVLAPAFTYTPEQLEEHLQALSVLLEEL
jgi:taurine---2-oxoglutarate transaminase